MDSRLKKALEAEAAVTTAKALAEIAPQLAALDARLARIEAANSRKESNPCPTTSSASRR